MQRSSVLNTTHEMRRSLDLLLELVSKQSVCKKRRHRLKKFRNPKMPLIGVVIHVGVWTWRLRGSPFCALLFAVSVVHCARKNANGENGNYARQVEACILLAREPVFPSRLSLRSPLWLYVTSHGRHMACTAVEGEGLIHYTRKRVPLAEFWIWPLFICVLSVILCAGAIVCWTWRKHHSPRSCSI